MRPFFDPFPEFKELNGQLQDQVKSLFADLKPTSKAERLPADTDFAGDARFKDTLVVLQEGYLTYRRNDRRLLTYEAGDLVGVERMFHPTVGVEISSSFPVTVDLYDAQSFFSYLIDDPKRLDVWSELLVLKLEIYSSLLAVLGESKLRHVSPRERVYKPGETIIREGERGSEVYSLIKGKATVSIQGAPVGEVKEDEVFGVLAALGDIPRTATVTATNQCHVLVVDKGDFAELMKVKPSMFEKVMQDMARAITDLNKQVATEASGVAYRGILGG